MTLSHDQLRVLTRVRTLGGMLWRLHHRELLNLWRSGLVARGLRPTDPWKRDGTRDVAVITDAGERYLDAIQVRKAR